MTATELAPAPTMTPQQRAMSRFADDVAHHQMTIVSDVDGIRHIRFGRPGSSLMAFQVTTWPYHVTVSGDMGTLVLTNHDNDMLAWATAVTRALPDLHYWGEKVVPEMRPALTEFSPRVLIEQVTAYVEDMPHTQAQDLIKRAKSFDSCDEAEAREWAYDTFQDAWEWRITEYTFRTVWLMMALQMAANQYLEATCPWDRVLTVGKTFPAQTTRALPNPMAGSDAVITGHAIDIDHVGSGSLITVSYMHNGVERSLLLSAFLTFFREPTTAEVQSS